MDICTSGFQDFFYLTETKQITKVFQLWEVIKDITVIKGLMLKKTLLFPVNFDRILQLSDHLII